MALEEPRVDAKKLLVESSKSKPEPQKSFDGEHDLEATHPIWPYLAENYEEHIDTCRNCQEESIWDNFSYMDHDRFSSFDSFVRREILSYFD